MTKKYPYEVELNKDRKLINLVKSNNIEVYNPKGKWTGYGYEKLPLKAIIKDKKQENIFKESKKQSDIFKQKKEKKEKIYDEKEEIDKWAKRLSKLTGLSYEESVEIAKEKIEYKEDKINELYDKQSSQPYATKSLDKIITKVEKDNPLKRIKSEEHARNILIAHNRHTKTNYEELLDEAKEKVKLGELNSSEVREYARTNYR